MAVKIDILGYGVEGIALANYFASKGESITIYDENPTCKIPGRYKSYCGPNVFESIKKADMVFRSPGIHPNRLTHIKNLTSLTEYFFEQCPCPIVGITGTKGKGTTSTLIFEMLKEAGHTVYLGGNIGTPPLEFLDRLTSKDIVVLELSSFQTQTLHKSPHMSVILNVTHEHMDYHNDHEEYLAAKQRLIRYQKPNDFMITNLDHPRSLNMARASRGVILNVSTKRNVSNGAQLKNNQVILKYAGKSLEVIPINEIGLIGPHNLENVLPAVVAASLFDVSPEKIRKVLKQFKGLPHRLEKVCMRKGVTYINDSFSTTPETSIAAIRAFKSPIILIAGGSEKHSDFKEWAKACLQEKRVKAILLTGNQSAARMQTNLKKMMAKSPRRLKIIRVSLLPEAIKEARMIARKGDIVLLSPACASFEEFENYKKRGELFRTLAKRTS